MFSTTAHIKIRFGLMRHTSSILQRLEVVFALMLVCLFMVASLSFSANLTNKKTINITAPVSYGTITNYQAGTGGIINVQTGGTLTATTSLDNNFAGATINITGTGVVTTGNGVTYTNGAGTTSNTATTGKITLGGVLTLGTGTFTTDASEVEYANTAAQTIASGVVSATYGKLTIIGGAGTKSLDGSIIVANQVTLGTGTTFSVAGATLTLNGTAPFTGTGTLNASTTNSTVIYNASGAQTVYTATYDKLTIQNGGTKTASGSITVNNNLTNTATFDLSTNSLTFGASASITNTGATIQTAGNVTCGATPTIGGTFIYQAATGTQSIGTANYTNLTLGGGSGAAGQKNFPAGTVGVSDMYSVSGGSRSYGTGTFVYNGTSAQSVAGEGYNNLTIATTGGYATASAAITLTGTGNLVINSGSTLDMAGFNSSTFPGGSNNNAGTIRWSGDNAYVSGTGTTEFYSTSAGIIASGTNYGNMLFSGTGMKTFTTNPITATGTMTVNSGALVTVNNGITLQINGNVTLVNTITNLGTINVGN